MIAYWAEEVNAALPGQTSTNLTHSSICASIETDRSGWHPGGVFDPSIAWKRDARTILAAALECFSRNGYDATGVAEGTLRPVDPELGAHMLVALGVGLVLQGVLDPTGANLSQVTGQTIRVLLEGLEQKGAASNRRESASEFS